MKYPHIVKYQGVWYPAGADVPNEATPFAVDEPKPIEVPKKEPRKATATTEKKRSGGRKPRSTKK